MHQLVICGDIHNKWGVLHDEIIQKDISDAFMIHVGDGGFGFFPRRTMNIHLSKQNELLRKRDIILYNVRGNHDNPNWFLPKPKMVQFFQSEDRKVPHWLKSDYYYLAEYMSPTAYVEAITSYSNIKFVEDYTVLELLDHRILCIGGAISVDRVMRVEGKDYFKNESVVYLPNKLREMKNIDTVVTHTAPIFLPPYNIGGTIVANFTARDPMLAKDLVKEREILAKMFDDLSVNNHIKYWIYGHFHQFNSQGFIDTQFIALMPNNTYFIR